MGRVGGVRHSPRVGTSPGRRSRPAAGVTATPGAVAVGDVGHHGTAGSGPRGGGSSAGRVICWAEPSSRKVLTVPCQYRRHTADVHGVGCPHGLDQRRAVRVSSVSGFGRGVLRPATGRSTAHRRRTSAACSGVSWARASGWRRRGRRRAGRAGPTAGRRARRDRCRGHPAGWPRGPRAVGLGPLHRRGRCAASA